LKAAPVSSPHEGLKTKVRPIATGARVARPASTVLAYWPAGVRAWDFASWCSPGSAQGGIMKEFVIKGRLTLERVTFHVSAETLEGALARAANGDFDGYDTDAAESVDWHMALASIEENS
jgi:hypothetical protein